MTLMSEHVSVVCSAHAITAPNRWSCMQRHPHPKMLIQAEQTSYHQFTGEITNSSSLITSTAWQMLLNLVMLL